MSRLLLGLATTIGVDLSFCVLSAPAQSTQKEWALFARLYCKGVLDNEHFSAEDRAQYSSLQTATAWEKFEHAVTQLHVHGNRQLAARCFRGVADNHSSTAFGPQSKELADLLDIMVAEDIEFDSIDGGEQVTLEEKVVYHIHNLRDVVFERLFWGERVCVFSQWNSLRYNNDYNAAAALRAIGKPAVPFLIELLNDRRPVRGMDPGRPGIPSYTILRYQDVAYDIIVAILLEEKGFAAPRLETSYLSVAPPETREFVIETIRREFESYKE